MRAEILHHAVIGKHLHLRVRKGDREHGVGIAAALARGMQAVARARHRLHATGESGGNPDTVLAVAFPDTQMQVLPYNRVVKDLGSHSPSSLLAKIREQFEVKEGPATPARKGQVAMFLDGACPF